MADVKGELINGPGAEGPQKARISDVFWRHALRPLNMGQMTAPDGRGAPVGACGDSLEIGIRVRGKRIIDIAFFPNGCAATIASGSAVTELARDKTLDQALAVTAEDVSRELGGLPPGHEHCAKLAVATLRAALRNYYRNQRHPWKAIYEQ